MKSKESEDGEYYEEDEYNETGPTKDKEEYYNDTSEDSEI